VSDAALLIDWDNICAALGDESLHCHMRSLPRLLVEHGLQWAAAHEAKLSHAIVFAPEENFDVALESDFREAKVELEKTPAYRQAADVRMFVQALLLNIEKRVDHFILVSEDQGFLALAHELESRSCTCSIWTFSKKRAALELVRHGRIEELSTMLSLQPCKPEPVDASYQLMACLASLALRGHSFLHFANARARIGALDTHELSTYMEITSAWYTAAHSGYFAAEGRRDRNGRSREDRRIAFDCRDVRRLFVLYDELLAELDKQRRILVNSIVDSHILLAKFAHPQLREIKPQALLKQLIQAQIIIEDVDGALGFASQTTRLGLVGSLRRLAASAWTIREQRGTNGLTRETLVKAWAPHARRRRGGDLTDLGRAIRQGGEMVDIAKAHGLLHKRPKGKQITLNERHPIAVEAKAGMETIVRLLLQHDGRTGYRSMLKELAELPLEQDGVRLLGETSNERESWLGLAVASGHTRQKPREDFVELHETETPLVARLRLRAAQKDAPVRAAAK
jgi:hypothetical protein